MNGQGGDAQRAAGAVLMLAASIIALELALMRCLAIARWHHFAYLVISTALLGFGASGTVLTFAGQWLRRRFAPSATLLTVAFAASVTLAFRAAEALPLDARYVLYSGRHAGLMLAYHLIWLVPFLLGATVLGLALMRFPARLHLVYGANLVGSGAGGALAVGLLFLMPAEALLYVVTGLGLAAALLWAWAGAPRGKRGRVATVAAAAVLLGASCLYRPIELAVDPYKALSMLRRWEAEGGARHLTTRHGPRARLDAYASPRLHQTMFAGLTARTPPPPQTAVLADGEPAATVFAIGSADEAPILDHTPMSVPYRLIERPRVLLLGEAGGVNVWLARRMGAEHVTVVQGNPQMAELVREELAARGGDVLAGPDLTLVVSDPRVYLERAGARFDLIQIVTTEGMAAEAGGRRALHEDFLLTEQGLALCLERLTDRGVVAMTRGTQAPPRDNVKLLATARAALALRGVAEPGAQLAQVRNYLAATTMAFRAPLGPERCARLAEAVEALLLDVPWAPCPALMAAEQTHQADGPPGEPYSWLRHAALQVLSPRREEFFDAWAYDVRPPTDDRPYFYSFFRWRSLPGLLEAYGEQWLRRAELGYVVLILALGEAVVVGAALILLPLVRLRAGVARGRAATAGYFVLLGLAYMMIEMACLLKFAHFLGDPIYAAAFVICAFLAFSGLGSAASRRLVGADRRRGIGLATLGVAAIALLYAAGLDAAFGALIRLPLGGRLAASVALVAPLAFLMGWPFPNGLALVERGAPPLLPWAWGANGFASVAAPPLTVVIALAAGYRSVFLLSAVLYPLAGLLAFALPGGRPQR